MNAITPILIVLKTDFLGKRVLSALALYSTSTNWLSSKNDTNYAVTQAYIAMEVRNLRDQILSLANSRDTNGQYILAGYKVDTKPFVADENGDIVHAGDRVHVADFR